jgi:hypothetical protein
MAFAQTWAIIQSITVGTEIPKWTIFNGNLEGNITVEASDYNSITFSVTGPNLQRVREEDFEKVYNMWDRYIHEGVQRQDIRERTRYSTYIIATLHYVQINNNGTLP